MARCSRLTIVVMLVITLTLSLQIETSIAQESGYPLYGSTQVSSQPLFEANSIYEPISNPILSMSGPSATHANPQMSL